MIVRHETVSKFDKYLITGYKLCDDAPEEIVKAFDEVNKKAKGRFYDPEVIDLETAEAMEFLNIPPKYTMWTEKLSNDAPKEAVEAFEKYKKAKESLKKLAGGS